MASPDIAAELRSLIASSPRDHGPCRKLFDRFDLDGTGKISESELQEVLHSWGEEVAEHEVRALLKEIDTDGDGEIDYEEFRNFMLNLSSANRNHSTAGYQAAYEKWTAVMHEVVGTRISTFPMSGAGPAKIMVRSTINPCIQKMRYAVRGELAMMAERISNELELGQKRNFDEVLFCNIGNPHSVGGMPITFYRQVLALCDCPGLLGDPKTASLFPDDVIERARKLTLEIPGGTGAYSHSQGLLSIRKDVADFIETRDGDAAFPNDIFLTNGASAGITMMLQILLASPQDAILIPIPQYPIYAALIEMLDAKAVGYELDEDAGWSLSVRELERSLVKSRARGLNPRAMVIINPGNPTGQTMDEQTLKGVVAFCKRNRLVLLADEVYQENVYATGKPFISAKRVVRSMGVEYAGFELVSFHSTSKGMIGECGRRGGYMELCGVAPEVQAELFKLACVGLCPNLDGQLMMHLMLRPPEVGGASFSQFEAERQQIFDSLKHKAARTVEVLNSLDGVSCTAVEGAMYVFPRITLPKAAIAAAEQIGKAPDMHYCLSLLNEAGICAVPGSGFGQKAGTWHLRMTFLPDEEKLEQALERFSMHHVAFLARYAEAAA
ncbi:MAG: aminotransferase class I/II-fold pyridoxal phosphate-dependent enzyme [Polyangiaceae bacterium]|nr:aminotransferase class I/II-fold pyridoxal phosphate-dependent enzyme [Polyangiaceae bacterium]